MTKKKTLKIIGYTLVIFLFVYLIINTNFFELLGEIKKLNPLIFAFITLLQFVTQSLLIFQWHRLSKSILGGSSMLKMANIFTKGTVIEAVTPGAKIGGEATRLYYLKKEFDCNTDKAVNIILIQKSISTSVLLLICVFCFIQISSNIIAYLPIIFQIIISLASALLISFMIGFLFFSDKLSLFLQKFKSLKKLNEYVISYSNSVSKISKKEWIIQFCISFFIWGLFPVKMLILAKSFEINTNFTIIIAITMTSYMMGMLPIIPGGLGTFEGTMVSLFSVFSVPQSLSLATTVIFRFITFWFVILASLIFTLTYDLFNKMKRNKFEK